MLTEYSGATDELYQIDKYKSIPSYFLGFSRFSSYQGKSAVL